MASVRERGGSLAPSGSSSALSDPSRGSSVPPKIRPSLGRFSLLHTSLSPGRSYATAVYDPIMAPTSSPAQSLVPSEAWVMLGRTDLEAYTSWDLDRKSTRLNSSHQIISYAV